MVVVFTELRLLHELQMLPKAVHRASLDIAVL